MPTLRSLSPAALLTTLVTAVGLFFIALSQGSYDVVDRQTAGVVIWWAVGLGALIAAPPRRPAAPGVIATVLATGIAGWIALHLGSSISTERSVVELGRAVTHLGPLVLIGWVLPKHLWRSVFAGLLIGAVAICGASLGQRLAPGFLGQTTILVFGNTSSRLDSPLGYWNAVGSWAVITAVLLIGVSSHHPRAVVRGLALAFVPLAASVGYMTYSRSAIGAMAIAVVVLVALSRNRWTTGLHVAAAAAAGGVAILTVRGAPAINDATGTAGGGGVLTAIVLGGLVAGTVAVATGLLRVDRIRLPRRAGIAGALAALVVAIVVGGVAVDRYGQKAWDQFNTPSEALSSDPTARLTSLSGTRMLQWHAAWDAWEANKATGTGAGTFELTWNLVAKNSEFVRDDHNAFLEALSEQGTIGFLLLAGFVLSMVGVVTVAVRRAASALDRGLVAGAAAGLAAFIFGTAVDWFWEVTALALFVLGLLGVLIAAGSPDPVAVADPAADAEGRRAARRPWPSGVPMRAGVVVLALLAVLIELPGLVGTSEVRRSEREVTRGDLVAARSHADQAIDILYWASSPYLQRALVDERAGEWSSAARSMRLAIRRDPRDWRLPLVLARIEAKAGRPQAALAAYRQAKRLRPNGTFFR